MLFFTFIYFKPKSYRPIERCVKLPALYFTWTFRIFETIFRELLILRPFGIEFMYLNVCMYVCRNKRKRSVIYIHIYNK